MVLVVVNTVTNTVIARIDGTNSTAVKPFEVREEKKQT